MLSNQPLSFKQQCKLVLIILAVFSIIELLNMLSGRWFNQFGLLPRDSSHLSGIAIAPLVHANVWHFISNIVPLAIFSFLMLQYGHKRFLWVSLWIMVVSGILVWLMGRTALHVGASGLLYGYFGFLVLAGFVAREFKLILLSVVVGVVYGGLIFGVFPNVRGYISWEYHLFGLLAGLVAAKLWGKGRQSTGPL